MKNRLAVIDGLRGFAAIYVIVFHELLPVSKFPEFVKALVLHGHRSVQIFFVLSGFLICGSLAKLDGDPLRPRKFLLHRFFRLVPLWWLLLLYFFFIGGIELKPLVYNLTFLFGFYGYDPNILVIEPAWSLFVELFFYGAIVLLIPYLQTNQRLVLACLISYIVMINWNYYAPQWGVPNEKHFIYRFPLTNFQFFFLGMLLFRIYVKAPVREWWEGWSAARTSYALDAIALLCFFAPAFKIEVPIEIGCALMVMAVLTPGTLLHSACSMSWIRRIGVRCYCVYISQVFIMHRLGGVKYWTATKLGLSESVFALLWFPVTFLCIYIFAEISWVLWERPWMKFAKQIEAWPAQRFAVLARMILVFVISTVSFPAFAVQSYPPAMRYFTEGWSTQMNKCPVPGLSADAIEKIILRSKDCRPLQILLRSNSEERNWHRSRPGFLACVGEIPGAQEAIDRATINIFKMKSVQPWLREVFDCDEALLKKGLRVSDKGVQDLRGLCGPPRKLPNAQYGRNFYGTKPNLLRMVSEQSMHSREILFLLGNTPYDCIDSFTFSDGPIVFGLPDGKISQQSLEELLLHELLVALDGKNPFPVNDPWSPKLSRDKTAGHVSMQNKKLRMAFTVLRSWKAERDILIRENRAKDIERRPELHLVKDMLLNREKCLQALDVGLKSVWNIPEGWLTNESIVYGLVWGKKNYNGPAIIDYDYSRWQKASRTEIIAEIKRNSYQSTDPRGCRALLTPDFSGVNFFDSTGPRPRVTVDME